MTTRHSPHTSALPRAIPRPPSATDPSRTQPHRRALRNTGPTLLVAFLLSALVFIQHVAASDHTPALARTLPAELLDQVDEMCARIVFVREKDFRDPPTVALATRDQMREILLRDFDADMPSERLQAVQKSLIQLALVPHDFDLRETLLNVLTEQIAGGYDPRSRTLFMVDSWSHAVQRFILSHELTHVLQDQHHDILSMPLNDEHNDDAALAARSLLESEAMLVSTRFLELLPLPQRLALLARLASEGFATTGSLFGMSVSLQNAPLYIRESLLFPYLQGTLFVTFAYAFGGWQALDSCYTHLPQSTEQILHPTKYFVARDQPIVIHLPDLADRLAGWTLLTWNVLGEFGTSILLRSGKGCAPTQAESNSIATRAAAGWGGDLYQIYEHADGRLALVWFSAWDTSADASEFHAALRSTLIRRYELENPTPLTEHASFAPADAHATDTDDPHALTWTHPQQHVISLSRNALDVLLVSGFDADITTQLVQRIWQEVQKYSHQQSVPHLPLAQ